MVHSHRYLAIDLGAESGRAILGQFDGRHLNLAEIHRFPNGPVRLPDGLHWDVLRLWSEITQGIAATVQRHGGSLASIGVDTWGVDFALLDRQGALLANPYHYRDGRTEGMIDEAFRRMPRERIYQLTGIQFMPFNTLYQLLSMVISRSPALDVAETFLTIPDLLNYWLTGQIACEFSNATTTQCYDPRKRAWAESLLEAMDIPRRLFPNIIAPGTVLGAMRPQLTEDAGATHVQVIAPACHDTGSAVVAVPALDQGSAWISSGTWSILGAEINEPVVNSLSLAHNFTNEGGVGDTWRLSKNVMGLWLLQECRREWARQGEEASYDQMPEMAAQIAGASVHP